MSKNLRTIHIPVVAVPKTVRSVSAPPKSLFEILQSVETSVETALDGFTTSLNAVREEEDIPGPFPKMTRAFTDGCAVEVTFLANLAEYMAKLAVKHETAEAKRNSEKEVKVAAPLCSICYEEFSSPTDVKKLCEQPDCDKTFCKPCLTTFIKSSINSGYGTCPVLKCPGCTLFLTFAQWKDLAEEADRTKYLENAKQILTLQCGNCHTRGTLLQAPKVEDPVKRLEALNALMTKLEGQLGTTKGPLVTKAFRAYCKAELGPIQFMQVLIPNCVPTQFQADIEARAQVLQTQLDNAEQAVRDFDSGFEAKLRTSQAELQQIERDIQLTEERIASTKDELASMRLSNQLAGLRGEMCSLLTNVRKIQSFQDVDRGAFVFKLGMGNIKSDLEKLKIAPVEQILHDLLPELLEVTPDQERRSSLHLRYCLMFPFVTSLCCKYAHCFKCKTKGNHEGKTCEENQAALPSEIRNCPQCNTALVKGDGCASIRCVCGHSFSWTSATITT